MWRLKIRQKYWFQAMLFYERLQAWMQNDSLKMTWSFFPGIWV
jgi:hypothetical protein